jgi:hypothetical protein
LAVRGYLNQPERTAKCFVVHPFSKQSAARLYKAEDVAHYLLEHVLWTLPPRLVTLCIRIKLLLLDGDFCSVRAI